MNIDDPSVLVVDRLPLFDDFRAFVHPSKLGELKLRNGSIVEIRSTSNRSALARIFAAAENVPFGYIQLGRALRLNVDCFLGEFVQVKKAKNCDIAECVVLAPIDDTIANITGTYAEILFNSPINFENMPLKKNMVIPVFALNRVIEFKVVIAQPTNSVVIENVDVIACRNTTVERGNSPKFNQICYDDIGGIKEPLLKIRQVIELPLLQPKLFRKFNLPPIKDLLITANSGCGKTLIAQAIRNETTANFVKIDCFNLLTKTVEQAIAFLLKTIEDAVSNQPSIVFFDDFDVVASPEVYEDVNPDSRISNALCSAIKRMRAEKSVIVIASARDDSKIRKDIKAKFDRKVSILYPIGPEKQSIVRVVAHRYQMDPNTTIDEVTSSLSGKSGAQLVNSCLKTLNKSIAGLSMRLNMKKKKLSKEDSDLNSIYDFSINQLRSLTFTTNESQENLTSELLFEDTLFDYPEKYKIDKDYNKSSQELHKKNILYDPDYQYYDQEIEPNKDPHDFEFISLFEGESPYNEGLVDDDKKKKYTYDDDYDDDYSDDYHGSRNNKKKQKTSKGKNKGRYDDYSYYSDDYSPRYKSNKKGQNNKKPPKRRNDDYYSDDYYSDDYYSDDYDDKRAPQNKSTKRKDKNMGNDNRNKAKNQNSLPDANPNESPQNRKFPSRQKGDFVNPFAARENVQHANMPRKKQPLATEENSRNQSITRDNEDDDEPPMPSKSSGKNYDEGERKQNRKSNNNIPNRGNPFNSGKNDDYSDDEESVPRVRKGSRPNPFNNKGSQRRANPFGNNNDNSDEDNHPKRSKKNFNSYNDEEVDDDSKLQRKGNRSKPKRRHDDFDEEESYETPPRKNKQNIKKQKPRNDSEDEEDEQTPKASFPKKKNPFHS